MKKYIRKNSKTIVVAYRLWIREELNEARKNTSTLTPRDSWSNDGWYNYTDFYGFNHIIDIDAWPYYVIIVKEDGYHCHMTRNNFEEKYEEVNELGEK